jgi:hypothetical protein
MKNVVLQTWMVFWLLSGVLAVAQSGGRAVNIKVVNKSRPLSFAANDLAHKKGWLISYEDQPYLFEGDKEDLTTAAAGPSAKPGTKPLIGPRRGDIDVSVSPSVEPVAAIGALIKQYRDQSKTEFGIVQLDQRLLIIPKLARDKSGNPATVTPLLSTAISMTEMERDGDEALIEFCKALTLATGTKVLPGTSPSFRRYRVRTSAINEPARDVLVRLLHDIGGDRVVWMLWHSPANNLYTLNLDYVPPLEGKRSVAGR